MTTSPARVLAHVAPRTDAGVDSALTRGLADLCEVPPTATDRHDLLVGCARAVRVAVPAAEAVGASLGSPDEPTAVGYAGDGAAALDALQIRTGEGPSLLADRTGDVVVSRDLATDGRWPRLARLAAEAGARSAMAAPVRAAGGWRGVVACSSTRGGVFGPTQRHAAELLAPAVGSVIAGVLERERLAALAASLDRALVSRQEIDEAKGIVIAEFGCSPDEAFAYLVDLSQRANVKLRALAHRVVVQAGLPPEPRPSAKRREHARRP